MSLTISKCILVFSLDAIHVATEGGLQSLGKLAAGIGSLKVRDRHGRRSVAEALSCHVVA